MSATITIIQAEGLPLGVIRVTTAICLPAVSGPLEVTLMNQPLVVSPEHTSKGTNTYNDFSRLIQLR
jgi:uncharacterized membrane protein (DUF441 family)